ncbi:MAG TPA: hypothetical protein VLB84_09230 [Bacteroidia bacterium]|nr:hypothetical protein [Bacteroidia bacterium]
MNSKGKKQKKRKTRSDGFELVEDTVGKICAGVFIHYEKQELKVEFAWGRTLHFKPVEND